jgi:hypothetical protein
MGKKKQTRKKPTNKDKDSQLVIRLNGELRDEFVDICKQLDTTSAREIRGFIRNFIEMYKKGEFDI